MLKFLQNKSSNRLAIKPLIKYQPQMIYGHTKESPNQFINRHTIYFNSTDQANFSKKIPQGSLPAVQCTPRKTFDNEIRRQSEPFSISSQDRTSQERERSKKCKRETDKRSTIEFNKTRGEFSNFLDRHKHYGSVGILHKENQGNFFATQTESMHKFNWNKSNHTQSKSHQTNSLIKSKVGFPSQTVEVDKSLLTYSKQSTFGMTRSNSVSIFEKIAKKNELKLRRDEFIDQMKKETKDKLNKKYQAFGLPRIGVQHQLFLLQRTKPPQQECVTQLEQMNQDIDKFQKTLYYKLK